MSKDTVKKGQGFPERLTALREKLGIRQKDAAEKFGVSVPTYRNWEKGRSEPQQFSSEQVLSILRGASESTGDPIYESPASAGDGVLEVKEEPIGHMPPSRSLSSAGRDVYWIPVRGDSMGEKYTKHTLVPVARFEKALKDINEDDVYHIRLEGAMQIKRLQRRPGSRIRVVSDNDAYENYDIVLDDGVDFEVLGRVLV